MTRDVDPLLEAARLIAQCEDPAAELMEIARLESGRRQRQRCVGWGAVAAVLLVGIALLWPALRGDQGATQGETRTALQDSLWMQDLVKRARHSGLATDDEARLRSLLRSDSSLRRRGAVVTLSGYGKEIDPAILEKVAFELAETIDLPLLVAAREGNHVSDALVAKHQATLRAVARAIRFHCARTHSYPRVETIEHLLAHPDEEVRASCCRALGDVRGYVLDQELRARLAADSETVRRAARRLLEVGK